MPIESNLFDLYINFKEIRLKDWNKIVPEYKFDKNISFFNIMVPT